MSQAVTWFKSMHSSMFLLKASYAKCSSENEGKLIKMKISWRGGGELHSIKLSSENGAVCCWLLLFLLVLCLVFFGLVCVCVDFCVFFLVGGGQLFSIGYHTEADIIELA